MSLDIAFVTFLVVAALLALMVKHPRDEGPPMSRQLENWLLYRDRRQRQLSRGRLREW